MLRVLAFVDDLMFLSRIREAARGPGAEVRALRKPEALVAEASKGQAVVLVDADSSRLPWADAVARLRKEGHDAGPPVVAFFSHVHTENADKARAAGCDRVMTRGSFVAELPDLLAELASASPAEKETPS